MSKKKIRVNSKRRLAGVFIAVSLLLLLCLFWAVMNVIRNREEYTRKSMNQVAGTSSVIYARPGVILDANGNYLAINVKVFRLILDPSVMAATEKRYPGSLDRTAGLLSESFGLDRSGIIEAFTEKPDSAYVRFMGTEVLSEEAVQNYEAKVQAFEEEKKALNSRAAAENGKKITARIAGVWFEEEYRRSYPENELLAKTVGYTTKDASQGITGLEYEYDGVLRGTNGRQYTYIDARGNAKKEVQHAVDGYDLETSLDINVSRILRECIAEFQEEIGGKRVNILVMDPRNGEIISAESDTAFDLNDPSGWVDNFTEEELLEPEKTFLLKEAFRGRMDTLLSMSPEEKETALMQQVQMNFPFSGTYEPGSTAKAFTLSAAIEEKAVNEEETRFECDHEVQVGVYTIHCHFGSCGILTPMEAFGNSCNVSFVNIGQILGRDNFARYQEIFNLGQKTGIDLPGEANTANLIHYAPTLNDIELSTCSFGQGFNVTMVQMASAYASLINGGYYYEPHVVRRIRDSEGNTVEEHGAVLVRRTVSKETSDYMKEALRYVVTNGTASEIREEGYAVIGKTGASEKLPRGDGRYVVSFIGAAPLEDPRFLIYTVVDEPNAEDQSQSLPAQILTRKCLDRLYAYYHIYPENADDVYTYDWSKKRRFDGTYDGYKDEEVVDEGDRPIDWIGLSPEESGGENVDPEAPENGGTETAAPPEQQADGPEGE